MNKFWKGLPAVAIMFGSCAGDGEAVKSAQISGKVENTNEEFALLYHMDQSGADTIRLNEDGSFNSSIDVEEGEVFAFFVQPNFAHVYLSPSEDLVLNGAVSDAAGPFDNMEFQGSLANEANYLLDRNEMMDRQKMQVLMQKEPTDFVASVDSLQNANELKIAATEFTTEFEKMVKADGKYFFAGMRDFYPQAYSYSHQGAQPELPEGYDNYKAELDLQNPENLKSQFYVSYLMGYIQKEVSEKEGEKLMGAGPGEAAMILMNDVPEITENQEITDFVINSMVRPMFAQIPADSRAEVYEKFNEVVKNETFKSEFAEEYNKMKRLEAGEPAPEWSLTDIDNKMHSLADYKGKYVYMDIWATWCGPCQREIPSLKELEAQFHDKDIVFVSVSIDDDKSKWETQVRDQAMTGVQLYAEGAGNSQIARDYEVKGIPRFVLIDKEGNIVNAEASRPSDPATKEMLESLFN